jgi:hypothetical protein
MRINERQEILKDRQFWAKACEDKLELFHKDQLANGDIRYIAKEPIEHGTWLIHSITIGDSTWACVSDNVEYLTRQSEREASHQAYRNKKLLKPLLELVSNWGQALFSYHTENKVTNKQFELLLGFTGVWANVNMRTKGFIRDGLNWISSSQYSTTSKSGSKCVFDLYKQLGNSLDGSEDMLAHLFGKPIQELDSLLVR